MHDQGCKYCGNAITHGARGPVSDFCCVACSTKFRRRERRPVKSCDHCGKLIGKVHGGRHFCSRICYDKNRLRRNQAVRKLAYYAAGRQNRTCTICGASYIVGFGTHESHRVTCSANCARENRKSITAKFAAFDGARRRGVVASALEKFRPAEIFNRDGWRCRICGVETPKSLRGMFIPGAPELDHIIPISKGGEHSRRNTQCLCRACNLKKSNKIAA